MDLHLCLYEFFLRKGAFNKNNKVKNSAASTRGQEKYTKEINFLWLTVVAAHDCKMITRALHACSNL